MTPGKAVFADPVTLLNAPPTISSTPPSSAESGYYRYLVSASDPYGDRLSYRLEGPAPGMTIDSRTGRIEWPVANARGPSKVRVVVEDGHGGYVFQKLEVRFGTP